MRTPIRFLIDEDVPDRAAHALANAGHEILFSRDIIGRGVHDEVVASQSVFLNAVVVTRNVRHFRTLSRRRSNLRLSYIGLACEAAVAADRLTDLEDVVVFMASRCVRRDQPLNLEINRETFSVKDQ